MTRDEARERAAALNAGHGDGVWVAREEGGTWDVVRVTAPGLVSVRPTGTHAESRPPVPEPQDARPSLLRNIPPYGAA